MKIAIASALVAAMWLGFTLREAGFVRIRRMGEIALKTLGAMLIACALVPPAERYLFGTVRGSSLYDVSTLIPAATAGVIALAVSGALAERARVASFLLFAAALAVLVTPIVFAWEQRGWLSARGFIDVAGAASIHVTAGAAALAGALVLGARAGRFESGPGAGPMPPRSLRIGALGTLVLWLGWFGMVGGAMLDVGGLDLAKLSETLMKVNVAAGGGVLAAVAVAIVARRKGGTRLALNGALAGLVALSADPLNASVEMAAVIGGVAGLLSAAAMLALEQLLIDDVTGTFPAHFVAGLWGTLTVPLLNPAANPLTQMIGAAAIGTFAFLASFVFLIAIKLAIGLRASHGVEPIAAAPAVKA